ncbi:MAG: iron chelate uptake ABC transporter family permease subunit [Firmicutes bacterium]|nr:iron chelate uptake ABC transporter family permease subunit [Bacillota bacterium]
MELPTSERGKGWVSTILILSFLLAMVMIISAAVGPADIAALNVAKMLWQRLPGLGQWHEGDWPAAHSVIVFRVRLPRIVLAALVGSGLAMAGTTYQGLLQNSMADPYIIGVSAGASVGATLGIVLRGSFSFLGLSTVTLMAFLGAVITTFLVYNIARVGGRVPVGTLLLAGVAVSSFLSAIVSFLMVLSSQSMHEIVYWMMGSLSGRSWDHVRASLPYLILGGLVVLFYSRELNLMLLGEDAAHNLGVNVERVKAILLTAGSLMAAAAVSVSGVIGFVGLIIPHTVRLLTGPDHRILLPAAALVGAIFLVAADTLARTIMAPAELPVGVITALAGAPFFLYLLRRQKERR